MLDDLLFQIDELGQDTKQQRLVSLLEQLTQKHIIVYTSYSDTADYLSQTLIEYGYHSFQWSGALGRLDYELSLDEFLSSGGIAVVSVAERLQGINFRTVLSTVILYDVPVNDNDLLTLASSVGPPNERVCTS